MTIAPQLPKGQDHDKILMRSTTRIILYLMESVR
jgi:hypothetical protein